MADSSTRLSLLGRLRLTPTDEQAWSEFVERYGRQVYAWCRQWGLQEADAEDVTQSVLADLARQMRTFEYQPSGRFRSWLRTIAHRAWCDLLASRKAANTGSGDSAVLGLLNSVEAREDLLKHLDSECERELLEAAMNQVQQRVEPNTWEAFRLTAQEGRAGAETAQRLGLQVAAVFKAKSRVQKMIREEVAKLEGDESHASLPQS
jgi:RNA polymerase sigma-70 factor (ECF subfamily)